MLASAAAVAGQAVAPPATPESVLLSLAERAQVIFAGRVVAVARQDAAGYVDVRFHVDDAVRGCAGTSVYVLREWAGLWAGQAERYRVGDRRLMFLTGRGPSGMSGPVDGLDGAVPLISAAAGPVMRAGGQVAPDSGVPAELHVDMRWLRTRSLRGAGDAGSGSVTVHPLAVSAAGAQAATPLGSWVGPVAPLAPVALSTGWTPAKEPALDAVEALLGGTVQASHVAQ